MLNEVKYCHNVMKTNFNEPLKMTDADDSNFQNAYACHI